MKHPSRSSIASIKRYPIWKEFMGLVCILNTKPTMLHFCVTTCLTLSISNARIFFKPWIHLQNYTSLWAALWWFAFGTASAGLWMVSLLLPGYFFRTGRPVVLAPKALHLLRLISILYSYLQSVWVTFFICRHLSFLKAKMQRLLQESEIALYIFGMLVFENIFCRLCWLFKFKETKQTRLN